MLAVARLALASLAVSALASAPSAAPPPASVERAAPADTAPFPHPAARFGPAPASPYVQPSLATDASSADPSSSLSLDGGDGSAIEADGPGLVGDVGDGTAVARDGCLTLPAGPGTYQCGDLVVAQGFPGVRVLNQARAPTLIYNSGLARPFPIVSHSYALPADGAVTQVTARLRFFRAPGVEQLYTSVYPGWTGGETRRISVGFDASAVPTGVYDYDFEVVRQYADGRVEAARTGSGRLAVVNRRESRFGAGWWLAGLEQLFRQGDGSLLWVGGDGSTRLYRPIADTAWVAAPHVRPDTLKRRWVAQSGSTELRWVRVLPGRAEVRFDTTGLHVETVNPVGHRTVFHWSGGWMHRVDLPRAHSFWFEYNNPGGRLSAVFPPWVAASRATQVRIGASGEVLRFVEAAGDSVRFGYDGSLRMHQRTDRRGVAMGWYYDAGSRLAGAWAPHPKPGQTAWSTFIAQESIALPGVLGARVPQQAFSAYNGWRDTVPDHTYFWLDRHGAPTQIVDPLGGLTVVERGEARFPALVTRLRQPDGGERTAAYDARGNVLTSTDWTTVDTHGVPAVTTYEWDPVWDRVTKVTTPEGVVARTGVDAYGRTAWVQPGNDSTRRTTFQYHPVTDPIAPGLPMSVTPPLSGAERYAYDALGNLRMVIGAAGDTTRTFADALGRDTLVVPATGARTRTDYDNADRPWRTQTIGSSGLGTGTLTVLNDYDPEGHLLRVRRIVSPDSAGIDTLTTEWRYDAAGRKVVEVGALGAADSLVYDPAGNVLEQHTRYSTIATGRQVIRMKYDVANRMTERLIEPMTVRAHQFLELGRTWSYPRFPLDPNHPASPVTIAGDTALFEYDGMSRMVRARNGAGLIRRSWSRGGLLLSETQRIYPYLGRDTLKHVYHLAYRYDLDGRRTELEQPVPAGRDTARWGYRPVTGELAWAQDLAGSTFTFSHDEEGRLWRTTGPAGLDERLRFDAAGRVRAWGADSLVYDRMHRVVQSVGPTGFEGWYDPFGALADSKDRTPLGSSDRVAGADPLANTFREYVHSVDLSGTVDDEAQTVSLSTRRMSYERGTGRLRGAVTREGTSATGSVIRQEYSQYDRAGNRVFLYAASRLGDRTLQERTASYYRADGRLVAVDRQRCMTSVYQGSLPPGGTAGTGGVGGTVDERGHPTTPPPGSEQLPGEGGGGTAQDPSADITYNSAVYCANWDLTTQQEPGVFEEYRYDALGRRVMVRARPDRGDAASAGCPEYQCPETLDRYVWDGDQILQEIRVATVDAGDAPDAGFYGSFGRIAYTHAGGIDRPISAVRYSGSAAHGVVVRWNWRALVTGATFTDGTYQRGSLNLGTVRWPGANSTALLAKSSPYQSPQWWGSVLMNMQDASGQLYRRNRYYDPATGRFTQEDPIGLAGGLNLYGFGGGDPVNYSDPFGLKLEFRNEAARFLWGVLERAARTAMKSDDESKARAGQFLLGVMNEIRLSPATWTFSVEEKGRIFNGRWGGARTSRHQEGFGRNAIVNARTVMDSDYTYRRYDTPPIITLAHEIGHAWAFMTKKVDQLNPSLDTENAARLIFGCSHGRPAHSNPPSGCY